MRLGVPFAGAAGRGLSRGAWRKRERPPSIGPSGGKVELHPTYNTPPLKIPATKILWPSDIPPQKNFLKNPPP